MTESCRERYEAEIDGLKDVISFGLDSVCQAESVLYTAVHELSLATKDCFGGINTNKGHLKRVLYLVKAVQTATRRAMKHLDQPEVES